MNASKNLIAVLLLLTLVTMHLSGKERTEEEAKMIAIDFFSSTENTFLKKSRSAESLSPELVHTSTSIRTKTTENTSSYYIYNVDDAFVIVSGDDRAKDILGYSDNERFNADIIPDNLTYWLSCYESEIRSLNNESNSSDTILLLNDIKATVSNAVAASIEPLVKTKWDQTFPYSNLCPLYRGERCVTGCAATAMAQVMKYHEYPKTYSIQTSYRTDVLRISVNENLSGTYDWTNMTNTYTSSSSETQQSAVATLMYHCGIAVEMDYQPALYGGSGATTIDIASALKNTFGYNENLQIYRRNYYTKTEWVGLIKTELNAGRPVYYAGYNTDEGHAFVCDGYDANGLFHFNWGWSGISDGYFELSALNPGSLGIGAGSGYYNQDQEIIVGVSPSTAQTAETHQLHFTSLSVPSAVSKNSNFSVTVSNLFNLGVNTFNGYVGMMLIDQNNRKTIYSSTEASLKPNHGWTSITFTTRLGSSISNGNYKLYIVYSDDNSNWNYMRGKSGTINYLNVSVTNSGVTFSANSELPSLQLINIQSNGNLYENKTGRLNVTISNTGQGEYNSFLTLAFDAQGRSIFAKNVPVVIAAGETKELSIEGNIAKSAGTYTVYTLYDSNNSFETPTTSITGNTFSVEVKKLVVNEIALTLTSPISFANNLNVTPNTFNLTVNIKNNGDYFDSNVYVALPEDEYYDGYVSYVSFDYQNVVLEPNEETTIFFTNAPNLTFGEQEVAVFYKDPLTLSLVWFSPSENGFVDIIYNEDSSASIHVYEEEKKNIFAFYNSTNNALHIRSDESVNLIEVIDMSGKNMVQMNLNQTGEIIIPLHHIQNGLHILRVGTTNAVESLKFVKK